MSDLRPCPFCGGEAYGPWAVGCDEVGNGYSVFCKKCHASSISGLYHGRDKAIEAWNTRTESTHIRQLEAALKERGELLNRALAIIVNAIMHGMPVTQEVADVRNKICRIVQPPTEGDCDVAIGE